MLSYSIPKWCSFKYDGKPDHLLFSQDSLVKIPFDIELNEDEWPTTDADYDNNLKEKIKDQALLNL